MSSLYYPVFISPYRDPAHKTNWRWGKPTTDVRSAGLDLHRLIRENNAPFGTVVEINNGEKIPLPEHVYPPEARKVIKRWEDLYDRTEGPTDAA